MKIEIWPIERPVPYENNARRLNSRAIDTVAASLKEFGWRQAIVVDDTDVIIAGHTRLLAAKQLGLTTVPVHVASGLTPAQVKAYRLMDNRSNENSEWDIELLESEIAELTELEIDVELSGFSRLEIAKFMQKPGQTDDEESPEPPEAPVSRLGDLWALGKHLVLCGDATDAAATARLVDGEKADMVFTDPPYNVDYEGYTKEKLKIQSDHMSPAEFIEFLSATFKSYKEATKPTAALYVCHPSLYQREFQNALENAKWEVRCQVIWAKNTFGWGFGRYKFQHEPIFYAEPVFYAHGQGQVDPWYGDRTQSTLWAEKKPAANRLHPTMKPVELIERALNNSSQQDEIVLDLFGGSGSTLIACEKTMRRARLMELDPKYCDVIVERWQKFTGAEATTADGTTTFAEVKALRATEPVKKPAKKKSSVRRKP